MKTMLKDHNVVKRPADTIALALDISRVATGKIADERESMAPERHTATDKAAAAKRWAKT